MLSLSNNALNKALDSVNPSRGTTTSPIVNDFNVFLRSALYSFGPLELLIYVVEINKIAASWFLASSLIWFEMPNLTAIDSSLNVKMPS